MKIDFTELNAAIVSATNEMREAVSEKSLRRAGFAGAEVFRDEAKRNAANNRKTGNLTNNIIVKRLEEESDGGNIQSYMVTVRNGSKDRDGAFYWRFVEFGHKFVPPNPNKGKGRKKAMWELHREAARLEYGTATAPAYPFMRPAFESKKKEAAEAVQAQLMGAINEALGSK